MTPNDQTSLTHRFLLADLLKQVSRSFYLTLTVVPGRVRKPIGLAYLFARAADTIADTDLIDRDYRLEFLRRFKAQFTGRVNWADIRAIKEALVPHQAQTAERRLIESLEECFRLYLNLEAVDRLRMNGLMETLTNGMEMDLTEFSGSTVKDLTALSTAADLDRYIYYVAGRVGEFWTEMMCAHLPALAKWDGPRMAPIGVRFGKGLQLTNVLKDVARDLQRGRCYIPRSLLEEAGLKPDDLLEPHNRDVFQPVLVKLIAVARDHLDQGWLYTMAIPRRELRLRLACMWPILFAGETLRLVSSAPNLLDPTVNVKISKRRVYGIMALTTLTGGCSLIGTAYWGRLRKLLGNDASL